MVSLNTFHLSPLDQAKIRLKPNLIISILHVYTEKHLPLFYSLSFCPQCQRSNLTLGKFQCLIISLLNTTVWVNSKQGKTVCKCTRAKITRGEKNPAYSRQQSFTEHSLIPLKIKLLQGIAMYWPVNEETFVNASLFYFGG